MKLKNLSFEDAKKICHKQLIEYDYSEDSCQNCPLQFEEREDICGLTFALLNKNYGDKEIVLERNDKDD